MSNASLAAQNRASARAPTVTVLTPPDFWGEYAIWGATGADPAGTHVFLGMTSNDDGPEGSARLFELDTATGVFADRGAVVAELARLGLRRPGEGQLKIHSRIVYGADGRQYFASMDEGGENPDGSRLPTWGGHLWRRGRAGAWEHLKSTPEALIAIANGGPYVYALGYFEHVIYQFDTRSSAITSVKVGAVGGHVSRNFFADGRGHVFAPRVTAQPSTAVLVEYDASLRELGTFPLSEYFERGMSDSHGIVGTAADGRGGWFFSTGKGRLYHQSATLDGGSAVEDLGWMNGQGSTYPASLFRDSRTDTLYSVSMPSNYGGRSFQWIARRADGSTTIAPFPYGSLAVFPNEALVYGSMTQDAAGRFYVVGTMNYKPLVLQVTPSEPLR